MFAHCTGVYAGSEDQGEVSRASDTDAGTDGEMEAEARPLEPLHSWSDDLARESRATGAGSNAPRRGAVEGEGVAREASRRRHDEGAPPADRAQPPASAPPALDTFMSRTAGGERESTSTRMAAKVAAKAQVVPGSSSPGRGWQAPPCPSPRLPVAACLPLASAAVASAVPASYCQVLGRDK